MRPTINILDDGLIGKVLAEAKRILAGTGMEVRGPPLRERLDDIDNMNDIDGLAALIAACDAVLTVSSTTAHLAGAVGAPTWVMVPLGRGHLWYWFQDRPVSPWYPNLQVRRQEPGQTWSSLIAELAPEIAAAVMPE